MSPRRLSDKYSTYILQPGTIGRDAELKNLIESMGVVGSVFQVLGHVPEQGEDLYTILIDASSVVTFEVHRAAPAPVAERFYSFPLAEYRRKLGQGKRRIRLDQAIENARRLLRSEAIP